MSIRVRFPPSPTGYLHVGRARTAIFNWLLARRVSGTLVLRIEDTDRERSSDEMTRTILDGMRWLGLDWDEGPFFQSDGVERHRADARSMVERGRAYRDFSIPEEVEADRAYRHQSGEGQPWRARALALGPGEAEERAAAGEPHAIRFHVPEGVTAWDDLVHGERRFENAEIADFVILRTDGSPTYNLAVVSDDAEMAITHVIRGDDHLSNTPKQILIYEALERPVPSFGHLPMILGSDGRRLSSRHGAVSVEEYREQGILPWALVNFLALLGWSPGDDREVMEIEELVAAFSLERVVKKSAVFDPEKLEWLNGRHLERAPATRLVPIVRDALGQAPGGEIGDVDEDRLTAAIAAVKGRVRTVRALAEQVGPLVRDEFPYDEKAVKKAWRDPSAVLPLLEAAREVLAETPFEEEELDGALRGLAESRGIGAGKLFQPLRVALTGTAVSPPIFDVILVLGRERCLARLDRARGHLAA